MKFNNKADRRAFIKKATLAGVGVGAAVTGMAKTDPVFSRLMHKLTSEHVDSFLNNAVNAHPEKQAELAFIQTVNNVIQLTEHDNNASVNKVKDLSTELLKTINLDDYELGEGGLLGMPQAISDAFSASYLGVIDHFNHGQFNTNELIRRSAKVQPLESDFLPVFIERVQQEKFNNPEFEKQLEQVGRPAMDEVFNRFVDLENTEDKAFFFVLWLVVGIGIIVTSIAIAATNNNGK